MDASIEKPAEPRRRWFRFSLRLLLIVVTVLAVPLGWIGWELRQVRREQATITWIVETGGGVNYQSNFKPDDRSWWEESTDKWFGERVCWVSLDNTQVSDLSPLAELKNLKTLSLDQTQVSDLSPLAELKKLEVLYLSHTQVSDLSPLAELKNLEWLYLHNTKVSDEQVQELRQALPNCHIQHLTRVEE
jgi:hypothetical protein